MPVAALCLVVCVCVFGVTDSLAPLRALIWGRVAPTLTDLEEETWKPIALASLMKVPPSQGLLLVPVPPLGHSAGAVHLSSDVASHDDLTCIPLGYRHVLCDTGTMLDAGKDALWLS